MKNLLKHSCEIEVLACSKAQDFNTKKDAIDKETGKTLYEIAYRDKEVQNIAGQAFTSDIISKAKSLIDLKPGKYTVLVSVTNMTKKDSSMIDTFYKVLEVLPSPGSSSKA